MTTPDALREAVGRIKQLLAQATPGPWMAYSEPDVGLPASLFAGTPMVSGFGPIEPLSGIDMELIAALRNHADAILALTTTPLAGEVRLSPEAFERAPKHHYWGAGDPNCPADIKAGNGELHTLRCRVCLLDNPRNPICHADAIFARAESGSAFCANINRVPTAEDIEEAIHNVRALCQFAYDQGYHELGYDPVVVLSCALKAPTPSNIGDAEAREALERIASGEAFRCQRFAEDDDAEYFLRAQRAVVTLARAALTNPPKATCTPPVGEGK